MRITEVTRTATSALNSNKLRSALTMLGVIIGVFSVVAMIAVGRGLQNYITDQFNELGSNLLFVVPGNFAEGGFGNDPASFYSRNKLEDMHVRLLETGIKDYEFKATPHTSIGETLKYKTKNYYSTIEAINHSAQEIYSYEIDEGRYFTKAEEKSKARVAILGPEAVENLFPNISPIGQKIKIGGDSYVIIGTFKSKGSNFDRGTLLPYTSAEKSFDIENITDISIKAENSDDIDGLSKEITRVMLRELKEDDFSIMSQKDILSSINEILGMLTVGLGAIAAVSLLVGGIGIMNIMFVSVTERTQEIGLRKALGATPTVIGTQFLMEATLLSLGGGIIGTGLGFLASSAARQMLSIRTEVPWWAVLLSFGFAAMVGIVFGTYPAYKASQKDPIEALRYE